MDFTINNGYISGVEVHPSQLYIFILSSEGFLNIFHKDTCELRGKISVPQYSRGCSIDPCGLFIAISTPSQGSYSIDSKTAYSVNKSYYQ